MLPAYYLTTVILTVSVFKIAEVKFNLRDNRSPKASQYFFFFAEIDHLLLLLYTGALVVVFTFIFIVSFLLVICELRVTSVLRTKDN